MPSEKFIPEIEAINLVGRAIFGTDWVGQAYIQGKKVVLAGLSEEDRKLIEDYGPRAGKRGGTTIQPCPTESRPKRDQAFSRQLRIEPQRGAAADWLIAHGFKQRGEGYNRNSILSALAADPPRSAPTTAARTRGRPKKFEVIAAAMRADIDSGERTRAELDNATPKKLGEWYRVDLSTAKKAREHAF